MSETTSSELKIVSTEKQKNRDIALKEKIQNYIKNGSEGDLWLQNTKITSLPNCLKVGGSLDLYNTPIDSLPESLEVEKNLYLNSTNIAFLPNCLKVGGDLNLRNTPIHSLQEGFKSKREVRFM